VLQEVQHVRFAIREDTNLSTHLVSAKTANQDSTLMVKVRKVVRNVQSIPFLQNLANLPKQIVFNVQSIAPLVQVKVTRRNQHVFASEQTIIPTTVRKELAFPVQSVPIVLPTMDSHWLNSRRSLDIGDQALTTTSFHRVQRGTVR
jgi:hypothetical protein